VFSLPHVCGRVEVVHKSFCLGGAETRGGGLCLWGEGKGEI